jgi:hypothetical protein
MAILIPGCPICLLDEYRTSTATSITQLFSAIQISGFDRSENVRAASRVLHAARVERETAAHKLQATAQTSSHSHSDDDYRIVEI